MGQYKYEVNSPQQLEDLLTWTGWLIKALEDGLKVPVPSVFTAEQWLNEIYSLVEEMEELIEVIVAHSSVV